jgi:asparagine synthase (glutamine-hydrolysing)
MSEVIGIHAAESLDQRLAEELVGAMRSSVTYSSDSLADIWSDERTAIARVHHGVVNREHQPIPNEDASLVIWMVGEVFGYDRMKERLIDQGHTFRYDSNDAEYCLHLFEEMGDRAFEWLNGSFVIVLYDRTNHEIRIVNDRFSSIPIYVHCNDQRLAFATQLHTIARIPDVPRRLDERAVFEFFTFGRLPGQRTHYEEIKGLKPATIFRYRGGHSSQTQYWKLLYKEERRSKEEYAHLLIETFVKAVSERTRGADRIGILLSGGLDSRFVLAADRRHRITDTFTVGDSRNRDVRYASRIAAVLGRRHHFLQRDRSYYCRIAEQSGAIGDGMTSFVHAHFSGFARQLREHADILFHGSGMQTLFRGYGLPYRTVTIGRRKLKLSLLAKAGSGDLAAQVVESSLGSRGMSEMARIFLPAHRRKYTEAVLAAVKETLAEYSGEADLGLNAWRLFDIGDVWCRDSTSQNILCLRPFINERTIAFDNALFDIHLRMPHRFQADQEVYKRAVKSVARDTLLIPNANTLLRLDAPLWVDWLAFHFTGAARIGLLSLRPRNARSYVSGISSWPIYKQLIRQDPCLQNLIHETLDDPQCIDRTLFDVAYLKKVFEAHVRGDVDQDKLLFLILTYGVWHKAFGQT